MKGLVIGGAVLAMTGASAQAQKIEVNLFGASAQYKFWTNMAGKFLENGLGCDPSDIYEASGEVDGRDAGIAVCAGAAADLPGVTYNGSALSGDGAGLASISGDTVVIRYTTNASYDGIRAVTDDSRFDTDGCTNDGDRLQGELETATLGAYGSAGTVTAMTCQDVHIGASDVAATTFAQYSYGLLDGPTDAYYATEDAADGGHWEERDITYSADTMIDPVAALYDVNRPIVVPFSFFAHDDGTSEVPFDNLSRMMAVALFSGKMKNWNEFDPTSISPQKIVLCLRHAGSGTAATLNAAVFRGDSTVVREQVGLTSIPYILELSPAIYFNSGSSALMKCVSMLDGAIGYADTNKCFDDNPAVNSHDDPLDPDGYLSSDSKCGYAKRLQYQGVNGSAVTIANGQYPFWSAQWLFSNETGDTQTVIDALAGFASDSSNMPSDYALFWAADGDMMWDKSTDFALPLKK